MPSPLRQDDFFRQVMEAAPYGIWVTDAHGALVYANGRLGELLGTKVSSLIGYPLRPFASDADGTPGAGEYWTGTTPAQHELRLVRADGHAFDAMLATSPWYVDGVLQGAIGLVVDVSTRASLTRTLQARERQLSNAEHFAHMGSWSWDIGSNRVQWSDELYRIYGLEPQSIPITFEAYLSRVHPDDRDRCLSQVQTAMKSAAPFAYDERIVLPDGSIRHLVSRGEFALGPTGAPERMIGICMDVTDRRLGEEQLDMLARFDPVTGLANRFNLLERAEIALERGRTRKTVTGFLLIDLDRFRSLNDSLGHLVGDRILAAAGVRLGDAVRPSDVLGRIGGDEFLIVLRKLRDPADAAIAARKVLAALVEPIKVDDQAYKINASIGVACAPQDGDDVPTLLKNADAAMYRAKQLGRGTFCFYSDAIGERASQVHRLTTALEGAIERGELSLHYQPCLRASDGVVTRVEALLRWTHHELGSVSPAQFIPLAEETGQIVEVGRWVLRTGCTQLKRWQAAGLALKLAVNVSARQLLDETFVDVVREILAETGVHATDLEFEITESTTVHDYPIVNGMLIALGDLGVSFAIDDFGTGYSSLIQLKRLPIDRLKIDRSFVDGLAAGGSSRAMVEAIVGMASALGLRTIAEGVETDEQLQMLMLLGSEEVQGYYLARPLTAEALEAVLVRGVSGDAELRLSPDRFAAAVAASV